MSVPAWVKMGSPSDFELKLMEALSIAWEVLSSISRNGCCDKCQEAALWSKDAMRRIEEMKP